MRYTLINYGKKCVADYQILVDQVESHNLFARLLEERVGLKFGAAGEGGERRGGGNIVRATNRETDFWVRRLFFVLMCGV